ncbi:MAG: class I SAM-dependent RNA methyltransferase [Cyanothece sp. SIO2G6]|nr:class I SAM-dependent RNA methyltransferase [Cyanothece sp. SIO2G6]
MSEYFATVARGLEAVAARELQALGARNVMPEFTGVAFAGDRALLYRVNLWARIPFRILLILGHCRCRNAEELYTGVQTIDWSAYLRPEQTLAVRATGKNAQLNHTHYTALQIKNAIVDQQRQTMGRRSSVDTQQPDVSINVHVRGDRATISLDSTGESLHRRGYRPAVGTAPLKETLAAALLDLAEWTPDLPLFDPMCGSGTFLLEAALKALNIAPGVFRDRFAFEQWSDFDPDLWNHLRNQAVDEQRSHLLHPIIGSDRDATVLEEARTNLFYGDLVHQIPLSQQDLATVEPPSAPGILVCNPPYGDRLGDVEALQEFYKLMGDVFKQRFKGWVAFVLSGNPTLTKHIGLRPSKRMIVHNGSIECRWLRYELF